MGNMPSMRGGGNQNRPASDNYLLVATTDSP